MAICMCSACASAVLMGISAKPSINKIITHFTDLTLHYVQYGLLTTYYGLQTTNHKLPTTKISTQFGILLWISISIIRRVGVGCLVTNILKFDVRILQYKFLPN